MFYQHIAQNEFNLFRVYTTRPQACPDSNRFCAKRDIYGGGVDGSSTIRSRPKRTMDTKNEKKHR